MRAFWLVFVLAIASILLAPGCITGCGEGYSEGDRSGTVTKFSRKGLLFKSWEGEMLLGGIVPDANGAAAANVWQFHAPDKLAKQIQDAQDKGYRVKMHYRQWAAAPIDQDSGYDVTSVVVEPRPEQAGGKQ